MAGPERWRWSRSPHGWAPRRAASDVGLLAAANDPVVGPVLRRVADKRLDFLQRIFRELGFAPGESRQRARIAYSAYLGWFELRRVAPHRTPLGRERTAYERTILKLVVAGPPDDRR